MNRSAEPDLSITSAPIRGVLNRPYPASRGQQWTAKPQGTVYLDLEVHRQPPAQMIAPEI